MNHSMEDNDKDRLDDHVDYETWLKSHAPSTKPSVNTQLPLERAVVNMLSTRVMEDESARWDAVSEIATGFGQLSDDLERAVQNASFQEYLHSPYKEGAMEAIAQDMQDLVERIEKEHGALDIRRALLGDVVVSLLRHTLTILQERVSAIRNAAIEERHVQVNKAYTSFDRYRTRFFSEMTQVLEFANDPFARAGGGPFEKEMIDNLLDALKVPPLPQEMLQKYKRKYENAKKEDKYVDFSSFEKDYQWFGNIAFNHAKPDLEEEIRTKRKELKQQKEQVEFLQASPGVRETILKEYHYWQEMTPEKRYKQLLRLRAFELLKVNAGTKRVSPEFMYSVYQEYKHTA
ncbi:hypothetical protein GF369_04660 [Candidatus Peregrinibacteria bacterium]|nr:hypothetical protein [Candidatus Peregrinibacteria bacterium]